MVKLGFKLIGIESPINATKNGYERKSHANERLLSPRRRASSREVQDQIKRIGKVKSEWRRFLQLDYFSTTYYLSV